MESRVVLASRSCCRTIRCDDLDSFFELPVFLGSLNPNSLIKNLSPEHETARLARAQ